MITITFLFVALVMPFVKKIAFHIGALDIPRDEEGHRHIHKKTTPKLGGLAIFFGFLLSYMIFGEPSGLMNSILIGSFIIIITGMIDDRGVRGRGRDIRRRIHTLVGIRRRIVPGEGVRGLERRVGTSLDVVVERLGHALEKHDDPLVPNGV